MVRNKLAIFATLLLSITLTFGLLTLMKYIQRGGIQTVNAAALQISPTVSLVFPSSAPNDLDTSITITGTNFVAVLSGTQVITPPAVYLGDVALEDVGWVSTATLTATVPWGMNPGAYTMTVVNPGGEAGNLPNAFTVTQAIGVWTTGGPYGGRVGDIQVHPITPTLLYATAKDAGVFRSKDGGKSWNLVFSGGGSFLRLAQPTPAVLYISDGGMAYRSDDSGETWVQIQQPEWDNKGRVDSFRLFPHPSVPGVVYGALGAWKEAPDPDGGLFRSDDYGQTWTATMTGMTDTVVMAIGFAPSDPLVMYAGSNRGNVFRSANGGANWEFFGKPGDYVSDIAVNPFDPNDVWVYSAGDEGVGGYLWRYDASTGGWNKIVPRNEPQSDEVSAVLFDPGNENTVWVGTYRGGFKSLDSGVTWEPASASDGQIYALVMDPVDSKAVYQGYWGAGVYRTADGGETWEDLNEGLAGIIPKGLAVAPDNPKTVYSIVHGSGVYKTNNGGESWQHISAPVEWPGGIAVDPFTSTRIYVGDVCWLYIIDSNTGQWDAVMLPPPPSYTGCAVGVDSLIADPQQPGHLIAGVGYHAPNHPEGDPTIGAIYTSTDFGQSWQMVTITQPMSPVISLAYGPISPTVIYAGTSGRAAGGGSGIWKSMDGGATWFQSGLNDMAVEGIAVDPENSGNIYAVANGRFFTSHDAGQTWTEMAGEMYDTSWLLFAPSTPPALYAYGWGGMKRTYDGGMTWERAAGSLGYTFVGAMAAARAEDRVIIYVGTGGGMVSKAGIGLAGRTEDEIVKAGVYRYTLVKRRTFLPMIFR